MQVEKELKEIINQTWILVSKVTIDAAKLDGVKLKPLVNTNN